MRIVAAGLGLGLVLAGMAPAYADSVPPELIMALAPGIGGTFAVSDVCGWNLPAKVTENFNKQLTQAGMTPQQQAALWDKVQAARKSAAAGMTDAMRAKLKQEGCAAAEREKLEKQFSEMFSD